jgi:hypothetical protein
VQLGEVDKPAGLPRGQQIQLWILLKKGNIEIDKVVFAVVTEIEKERNGYDLYTDVIQLRPENMNVMRSFWQLL